MLETLKNCWRVPELRKKILYTVGMLLLYRLAGVIPVAGIDIAQVQAQMQKFSMLGFMSMMTGNQFNKMTIMAMGITPYINSSIIMQLLTVAIPTLEKMQKEGEEGRKKIAQITRYVTVVLGFIQAVGLVYGLGGMREKTFGSALVIGLSMAAGSTFAMWTGEHITQNGVGNGVSLLIFSGIISNLFTWTSQGISNLVTGTQLISLITMLGVVITALVMIVSITFVNMGERRIPVQYAKRVVGRKMLGGQSTHIPMKVDSSGVLPLIFAMSIIQFPGTIMAFWPNAPMSIWWNNQFLHGVLYQAIMALMIIFFTYFYSSITFNPVDISKNLQQNGGIIPGIRQGKPTSDFLARTSHRIVLFDGIFLAVVWLIPTLMGRALVTQFPYGPTSLLIAVSVALETIRQLESQLLMRNYKGFL